MRIIRAVNGCLDGHRLFERRDAFVNTIGIVNPCQIFKNACGVFRFAAVERVWETYGGAIVLKGAGTLVYADSVQPPAVCSDGNPGMASGGMGDLLTGLIAAFIAQGFELEEAACMGVCLHAAAGDAAAARGGERGLLASDLLPWIRNLLNPEPAGPC